MPASLIETCVWLALSFEAHPWLWCRATQRSFLRLASTPALLNAYGATTATNRDAIHALQALSALPQVAVVEEAPNLMAC